MFKVRHHGNYKKTETYLKKAQKMTFGEIFRRYGELGVKLLEKHTPVDTGLTSQSWEYSIEQTSNGLNLVFLNTHVEKGINIALLIQYDHATGTGGFVPGQDYINPAIQPLFEALANDLGKEVKNL